MIATTGNCLDGTKTQSTTSGSPSRQTSHCEKRGLRNLLNRSRLTTDYRYIHDAFDPWTYAPLVGKQGSFVALDHHLYRCFTQEDGMKSGQEHAQNLGIDMAALSGTCNGSLVIGEWSAALHAEHRPENAQDDQRRAFCRAELDMFERFAAGWFFWTYKVRRWLYDQNRHEDWDSGWSARSACEADVMPKWVGFQVKNQQVQGDGDKGGRLQMAYGKPPFAPFGSRYESKTLIANTSNRYARRLLEPAQTR